MKSLISMVAIVFLFLVLPGIASAQAPVYPQRACIAGTPHATTTNRVGTVTTTTPNIVCSVNCIEECSCDRGYHMSGSLTNGDPRCVRNVRGDTNGDGRVDVFPPVCVDGGVLVRGACECQAALVGARIRPFITRVSREDRRAHDLPLDGVAWSCSDPMATGMMPGAPDRILVDRSDQFARILCASAEGASDEQMQNSCRATRALIDSIPNIRGGVVTIHHGDRNYTVQEFVDELLVPKFGEIAQRLMTLEGTVREHGETLIDHEERLTGLRTDVDGLLARPAPVVAGPDGRNSVTMAVGLFGLYGLHTAGPTTAAGGLSLALHLRPGLAPLDIYARVQLGGQYTGYSVGGSPYVSAAAGVSIYLGDSRRKTMLQLGLWGEDLWDPASDPAGDLQADSIGWSFGGEIAVSIPLHPNARLVLGVAIGAGERRYLGNGALAVLNGAVIQPFVRLEALLPSF